MACWKKDITGLALRLEFPGDAGVNRAVRNLLIDTGLLTAAELRRAIEGLEADHEDETA